LKKGKTDAPDALPRHVAIIMDGNGRWAKEKGKPRSAGHREGARALRRIVPACNELGVSYLTVYAFSVDNWKRPRAEVSFLFRLIQHYLRSETETLIKNGVFLRIIGDVERFPAGLQKEIARAVKETSGGRKLVLTIALGYGGQEEIVRAAAKVAGRVKMGEIGASDISKADFENELYTAGLPPVDLLIRTGGEKRLSNFLLYQSSYAELYFLEKYWPDFGKEDLDEALKEYARRERRFGALREEK
jgi:undecaprenyl diphosphate synthase